MRTALRSVCGVLAVVWAVGLLPATSAPQNQTASLASHLLVATPDLHDPHFEHAVVYLLRHDPDGAIGLIVNAPLGEIPLAVLLSQVGLDTSGATGTIRLHQGGPVETARVSVLHTDDYADSGTLRLGSGLACTWQPTILQAIAAGTGPRRAILALGYAGWGPGQLEQELGAGAWVDVPADEGLVFDGTEDTKWDRAFARRRITL